MKRDVFLAMSNTKLSKAALWLNNKLRKSVDDATKVKDVAVALTSANQANAERRWADAASGYKVVLSSSPHLADVWVQYGHSLKEQGFLDQANEAYERSLSLDPENADTYLQLGHLSKLRGDLHKARDSYERAAKRDPSLQDAVCELESLRNLDLGIASAPRAGSEKFSAYKDERVVGMLKSIGLIPEVITIFDEKYYFNLCIDEFDQRSQATIALCIEHFCKYGFERFLAVNSDGLFESDFYLETYLPKLPFTSINAYRHYLNYGHRNGWVPNRRTWLSKFLHRDLAIDTLPIGTNIGQLDGPDKQRWVDQVRNFVDHEICDPDSIFVVNSQNVDTLSYLCVRLIDQGRINDAYIACRRVLRYDPENTRALSCSAYILIERECYSEAQEIYRKLIERRAGMDKLWFVNLSRCHLQLSAPLGALAVAKEALNAFPGDQELQERFDEIATHLIEVSWRQARTLAQSGAAAEGQNKISSALQAITAAIWPEQHLPSRPIRSVAIVANLDLPQCRHYRVDQKLEQFRALGLQAELFDMNKDIEDFSSQIAKFQAVIFYRVPAYYRILKTIALSVSLGLKVFYEIDDLIFDSQHYPDSFASYDNQIDFAQYVELQLGVPMFDHAMRCCDYGIASTEALMTLMKERVRTGKVFLHRNALSPPLSGWLSRTQPSRKGDQVTIFYGSGTKAHKEDFRELVEPALVETVMRYPGKVKIILVGYFNLSAQLEKIKDHLLLMPPVWDFEQYLNILSLSDINLAVLKPSLMADCKSEIKWSEAAALGIPSIVSATANYISVVDDGVTGLIAADPIAWTKALDHLVNDPALRARIGKAARDRVAHAYGIEPMSRSLAEIFMAVDDLKEGPSRARVAIVNVFYPPQAIGGATRVVHDNVRELVSRYSRTFEVEIFCSVSGSSVGYRASCYAQDGVMVTGVTTPPDVSDIDQRLSDRHMRDQFGKFLDRFQPNIVHFHCVQRLTESILLETASRSIPYLITAHDGWWISDYQFLLNDEGRIELYDYQDPLQTYEKLGRHAYNRLMALRTSLAGAERVLAVSESFAEIYRSAGVDKVSVIENGVSSLPSVLRSVSAERYIRLAHIGGAAYHKGFDLLKQALSAATFNNLSLLVVDHALSPGDQRKDTWGTTPVTFIPKVNQFEIAELYANVDVLIAPSLWPESYGLVAREALACGIHVIASDRGSIGADVVDDESGFIINVDNTRALRKALHKIDADPERFKNEISSRPSLRDASDQANELASCYLQILTSSSRNFDEAGPPQ